MARSITFNATRGATILMEAIVDLAFFAPTVSIECAALLYIKKKIPKNYCKCVSTDEI